MVEAAKQKQKQVLWMADCYNLAKKFPDPRTWIALLEDEHPDIKTINPFQYWLWIAIWKAAQTCQSSVRE